MKKNKKFSSTIDQLSVHYNILVKKFGDDVKSSQQSNNETREKRLIQLTKYIEIKRFLYSATIQKFKPSKH